MALVTLIGSHDERRFMGEQGATIDGLKLAYTFLLTYRGIPLIYYGDEIGMPGGGDPENRRDFPGGFPGDAHDAFTPNGRTADEQAVFAHVQKLLRLRASRADLRTARMEHLLVSEQQYVFRRGRTVVALNNDTKPAELSIPVASLPSDALGVCGAPRSQGGRTTVTIPARSGCVF
jgi:glycosidase